MGLKNPEKNPIAGKFLQTCDISFPKLQIDPFTMVIFGGTGDLSRKKLLPTLFHLFGGGELSAEFSILGIARSNLIDEEYRQMMKEAVQAAGETPFDEKKWDDFKRHLFYFAGTFAGDEDFKDLSVRMDQISVPGGEGRKEIIYYLALPPQTAPQIVEGLKSHGLCQNIFLTKIIVEKPFGRDLFSARQLNHILRSAFEEKQIFRIDHYLGKETVQNIIFFRFSNSIFEQLWNRRYIDHIQITVAEELGIENRAAFYEQSGVIRDIVQNHILQVIGMVAMEPPIGFDADFIRDEKTKVFRSIQPMDDVYIDQFLVRGQYGPGNIEGKSVPGYREEKDVPPASNVPTFFAGKLYIANWRWAGIPFYIRTGKRMAKHITEIAIEFNQPPLRLFGRTCDALEPNVLFLTLQPNEGISLHFGVKYPHRPNQISTIQMNFNYQETFKMAPHPAYERLLIDCMKGDLTLFVREDTIEAMWELVDPILRRWEEIPPRNFPNYPAGTWGPLEAETLLEQEGRRWRTR